MPIEYDLVILGATELGCRMALRASQMGARVALVEQSVTPEDALRYRVMVRSLIPQLQSPADERSWLNFKIQDQRTEWSIESLQMAGVDYIANAGNFVQKPVHGFQVGDRLLRSSRYVSALSGDRSVPLGLSNMDWVTPEAMVKVWVDHRFKQGFEQTFELKPKRVAIVGEMPVGVELAQVLRSQGADVLLVVPTAQVLPQCDPQFADRIHMSLEAQGVEVVVGKSCEDRLIRDRIAEFGTVVLATPLAKLSPERLGLRSLNRTAVKQNRLRMVGIGDALTANVAAIALSEVQRILKPWVRTVAVVRSGHLAGLDAAWVDPPKSPLQRGTLSLEGMGLEEGRLWYRVWVGRRGEMVGAYFVGDRAMEWASLLGVAIGAKMRLPDLLSLPLPDGMQTALVSRWFGEWERQVRSPLCQEFFLDWLGFVRRRSK